MDDFVRGAVGKRLFGAGLTAGTGYDRYSTDVAWAFLDPSDPARTIPHSI